MEEQRWVKTHAATLTGELQEAGSVANFGSRLLSGVAPLLGGGVAAFYVADGEGGDLRRVAGYGLAAGSPQSVAGGEGLAGQCARDRKPVALTALPPDYLRIGSAVGEAPPAEAGAWPLITADSLLAVFEFASFRPLAGNERTLLDEFLPVAAMSLEVLQRNIRTRELLDETRMAEERLKAPGAFFRSVLELAPDGLMVTDGKGVIQLAHPQG